MSTLGETQPRSTVVFDLAGQCLDSGLVYEGLLVVWGWVNSFAS